jgi:hypothetical protein
MTFQSDAQHSPLQRRSFSWPGLYRVTHAIIPSSPTMLALAAWISPSMCSTGSDTVSCSSTRQEGAEDCWIRQGRAGQGRTGQDRTGQEVHWHSSNTNRPFVVNSTSSKTHPLLPLALLSFRETYTTTLQSLPSVQNITTSSAQSIRQRKPRHTVSPRSTGNSSILRLTSSHPKDTRRLTSGRKAQPLFLGCKARYSY